MHLRRWLKHGDPLFITPITGRPLKGDVPTFASVHKKLGRTRGAARNFSCADCGGRAVEWSYNHRDPDEITGRIGASVVLYSLDLANYDPRCRSCHRKFDGAGDRERNAAGRFVSLNAVAAAGSSPVPTAATVSTVQEALL